MPTSREALGGQTAASVAQTTTARPSHSDSPTQRGVDAGSRLYEFWNAIFARAGAAAGEPPSPATPRLSGGNLISDAGHRPDHLQAPGQWWPVATHLTPRDGADPALAQFQEPAAEVHTPGSSEQPESLLRNDLTGASAISNEPDVNEPAHAATSSLPDRKFSPPQRSTSSDSVSVFLHGAAVSIVVRDGTISARQAVDYAFETARQLTGQRSTLLRLTLNGQTLYQQPCVESHAQPALLFAC